MRIVRDGDPMSEAARAFTPAWCEGCGHLHDGECLAAVINTAGDESVCDCPEPGSPVYGWVVDWP